MNHLETEIKEYLTNNDITNMTVKEIADHFYISRALVYKVINKLGYTSFSSFKKEKFQYQSNYKKLVRNISFSNYDLIDNFIETIHNSYVVYVVSLEDSNLATKYMKQQLINLNKVSIEIIGIETLKHYFKIFSKNDLVVLISNNGNSNELYNILNQSIVKVFVLTQYGSCLYKEAPNHIGINTNAYKLADKFERENMVEIIIAIQYILDKFREYKVY